MNISLISVIVPTLNSEDTILNALKSVLCQSYKQWEIIVIDSYSSDKTISLIKSLKNKKIKIIFSPKKKGLAEARYKGITVANGNYIAFLDSDDIWNKKKLELQLDFMKKKKSSFSCTEYIMRKKKRTYTESLPDLVDFNELIYSRPICQSSVIIKKEIIEKISKRFKANLFAEDYLWWLMVLKKNRYCSVLKQKLVTINLCNENRSRKFFQNYFALFIIYKRKLNFSLIKIFFIFLVLIVNTFKKNIFKLINLNI